MAIWSILTSALEVLRSFRGALLVQLQSVGLWEGRQFRQYRVISGAQQFRFNAAKPFILSHQLLYCDEGQAQVRILTGATPSGTWAATSTQTGKNRYSPAALAYVQQCVVEAGGTFAGGDERELLRADSGSGQGISYGNVDNNVRILPAGVYYFDVTVSGSAAAIYTFEWEELP